MRIAIVTPYTLLNLGLKHLLQKYFEVTPSLYSDIGKLLADSPEQFDAYILFADTLVAYSDFFLPRKSKTMLLTPSRDKMPETVPASLGIYQPEEEILDTLERFIELLGKQAETLPHDLSPRETEVLKLVARGLMNKEIADRLNISINTVLSHRKNLTAKLGIKTVSGLSFYAMMNGYISDIDNK